MKSKYILVILFVLTTFTAQSQKVDKQNVEFDYIQLPLSPLSSNIKSYTSEVMMAYEAEINAEKQKAQEDYERELAEYPQKEQSAEASYKAAMEKYEADMKAWEEKSTTSKIIEKKILEENNKPVKPGNYYPPSKPYLREVRHQKIFNPEMLANTYLKLEGYTKGSDNAVRITTTLYGFESTEPELKSEESSYYDSKTKTTSKVMKYWYEISYKHPINLKVETSAGEVILDETFAQFNEYSLSKTPVSQGNMPSFNKEEYLKKLQTEVVESNMKFINEYLNSMFGFAKMKRATTVFSVEAKKFQYDDFQQAYLSATAGYNLLISDNAAATQKIEAAIQNWEKALLESNPEDKKARVDADVTIAALFNLAEAYIWINDFAKAEENLNKIVVLNPSRKEKTAIDEYREMLKDHKERWDASNG